MEPTPKAHPITEMLDKLGNRTESIKNHRCVPKPIGCGRQIEIGEFEGWQSIDIEEYRISGLCVTCQAEIFKEAFAASNFRARFEAKGRFSKMLSGMPTWLILDENPGLIGLANMPLE